MAASPARIDLLALREFSGVPLPGDGQMLAWAGAGLDGSPVWVDAPAGGGAVESVDGRAGAVTLGDLYAPFAHGHAGLGTAIAAGALWGGDGTGVPVPIALGTNLSLDGTTLNAAGVGGGAAADLSIYRATNPIGIPIAWDSFDRADSGTGAGSLGMAESGHPWIDITEPVGGWGLDRARYWKIVGKSAAVHAGIGMGTAIAVVDDPDFALVSHKSLITTMLCRGDGGLPHLGPILRYIDENNWISSGIGQSGRGLYIQECKNGFLSDIGFAGTSLHTNSSDYDAVEFRTSVSIRKPGVIGLSLNAIGFGASPGLNVRILEVDDPAWFAALASATRMGIGGGGNDGIFGWATGKVIVP